MKGFLPARLLMLMMKPAAARLHRRDRGARAVEDAAQVGVDDLAPVVEAHVGDVAELADAGVVDEHVEAAESLHGLVDEPLSVGRRRARRRAHVSTLSPPLNVCAAFRRSDSLRALIATCMPRSRNARATASPIPFDPPVTMPTMQLQHNPRANRIGLACRPLRSSAPAPSAGRSPAPSPAGPGSARCG